ncbi:MAG: helix-turn-helix domain-containing protein [Mitsuaria chitosanitabida]|uniref:helix-turn-helix transcriptional regulator n=1 Tax=Roseateles chitosanitabidus TaxID=65048 RepID=UPI001B0DD620|nr:helix-turn-helix domain-containing protein [Roseateles chitosanitabidus]MBO9685672.1 helix-turn-helix domain-containing protein [Roseateles chitosanitabidus]
MEPSLVDAAEVASLLGVSRRMVYDLASTGRLRCYRYSARAIRFDLADVEAFRQASRVEVPIAPQCRPPTKRFRAADPGAELQALFAAHGVKPRERPPGAQ